MAGITRLRERVAVLLECGVPIERIGDELAKPPRLRPEQRAALWRYARASKDGHAAGYGASRHSLPGAHEL